MTTETPFKEGHDFDHFRKVIMRETAEGPVPILELVADVDAMAEITGMDFPPDAQTKLLNAGKNADPEIIQLGIKYMDMTLEFSLKMGYDYVTAFPIVPVPRTSMQLEDDTAKPGQKRGWQNEHSGLIASRKDFDNFPWPSVEEIAVFPIDYTASKMPESMKVMAFYFGIFEDLRALMGIENLAIKSIEEPDLVDDILERLTALAEHAMELIAAHPATGAVFYADDMGFNLGTMLSPKWFREYVIPRQKRIADICHKHDKPFLLHSCGQVDALMEDLIEVVGIDARHSFEDNIEPVEDVYKKYGDRIAVLGGVDVNLLSIGTPDQVRARTRQILEACAPGGGYCVGSGNSVTNYCKIENYYAMIDETKKWNKEHS